MTTYTEKPQGRLLALIGVVMMVITSSIFAATVFTYPSAQCGPDCQISGLYSTFGYLIAGFNVLVSFALIAVGRSLKKKNTAHD